MLVEVMIPGIPVPKGRPRLGKNGAVYTPERTSDYEQLVKDIYGLKGKYLGDSAILAEIVLYFPIPKSYSEDRIKAIQNGEEHVLKSLILIIVLRQF